MSELSRLGDHVDLLTGFPFKSSEFSQHDGDVRLLRGDNVGQRRLHWDGAQRWPAQRIDEVSQYRLGRGDVIVAMDRPWISSGLKVAEVRDESVGALLVQRVARLRAKQTLDQGFLKWLLYSRDFTDYVLGVQTGTAVPHISGRQIADYRFVLPPLEEQRRIAAVLGAFDDLIEINRQAAAAALELAIASFGHLCAGSFNLVKLSDVTTKIGSGATPRGGKDVYQAAGVAFIRSQNVYDGQFAFDGLARISDAAAAALRGVSVLPRDVLVNITGESVTRTALVSDRALPARVSQHVAIVRPDSDVLDSGFLMLALLSAPVKAHLNRLSTAGATRRALTKTHIAETRIPLPPLVDQSRVSSLLDARCELEDEIADLITTRDELLPLLMSGKVRVCDGLAVA